MALFSLKKRTLEIYAASVTQEAMALEHQLEEKKENALSKVPALKKIRDRISEFDDAMTEKLGKNYTKVRNIAVGAGKFYVATQIGIPAVIALGAVNAVKAVKPIVKTAEEQRKEGKVTGLFDFISQNRKTTAKALAGASLGAAAIGFGIAGMVDAKTLARVGATALVLIPEIKMVAKTAKDIITGKKTVKQSMNDLGRDVLATTLSAASFIVGNYGYLTEHLNGEMGMGHVDSGNSTATSGPTYGHTTTTAGPSGYSATTTTAPVSTGADSAEAESGSSGDAPVSAKGADKDKNKKKPSLMSSLQQQAATMDKGAKQESAEKPAEKKQSLFSILKQKMGLRTAAASRAADKGRG